MTLPPSSNFCLGSIRWLINRHSKFANYILSDSLTKLLALVKVIITYKKITQRKTYSILFIFHNLKYISSIFFGKTSVFISWIKFPFVHILYALFMSCRHILLRLWKIHVPRSCRYIHRCPFDFLSDKFKIMALAHANGNYSEIKICVNR